MGFITNILYSIQGYQFRKKYFQQPAVKKQLEPIRGYLSQDNFIQLIGYTLLRNNFYAFRLIDNGLKCICFYIITKLGSEPNRTHHSTGIGKEDEGCDQRRADVSE